MDLPPSYGGAGLQSLEDSADEKFLGSFAAIATTLISFCKKTEQRVYTRIAKALESLDDPEGGVTCPTLEGVKKAMNRSEPLREPLSEEETAGATCMVRGTITVEVPGRFDPEKQDPVPEPITLPEPRLVSDFVTAPCKHEYNIIEQVRQAKKAHRVLSSLNPVKQALLRATEGQCGMDSASCTYDGHGQGGGWLGTSGKGIHRGGLLGSLSLLCGYTTPFWPSNGIRETTHRHPPEDLCMLQGTPMGLIDSKLAHGPDLCMAVPLREVWRGRAATSSSRSR
jgi:hypothetical protein